MSGHATRRAQACLSVSTHTRGQGEQAGTAGCSSAQTASRVAAIVIPVLHEFLTANRGELIERCALKVARRPLPEGSRDELEHGIPQFLDQLIKTLCIEQIVDPARSLAVSGASGGGGLPSEIGTTAARHG